MKVCPKCGKQYGDDANFCPTDAGKLQDVGNGGSGEGASDLVGGRFHLDERVGGGPTGEVFRATDTQGGGTVALKMVAPEVIAIPLVAMRVERELRQLERVGSKAITKVIASGKEGQQLWIATELVEGGISLYDLVGRDGPIDPQQASDLVVAIGEALIEAAKVGVVHRDLAPKNVLLIADQVKLINFCLPMPTPGKVPGVPEYVAPELVEGKPIDQRSNIYSLGALFFFLLTGKPPFDRRPGGDPQGPPGRRRAGAIAARAGGGRPRRAGRPGDGAGPGQAVPDPAPVPRRGRPGRDGPEGGDGRDRADGAGRRQGGVERQARRDGRDAHGCGAADRRDRRRSTRSRPGRSTSRSRRRRGARPRRSTPPARARRRRPRRCVPQQAPAAAAGRRRRGRLRRAARPRRRRPGRSVPTPPAAPVRAPSVPPGAQSSSAAGGKRRPPEEKKKKSSKGKFRETMWFKKGELDAAAADEAAAEAQRSGDAAAPDKADALPIEDRYEDDGSITRGDAEKYSLKTGATSMMPAIRPGGPQGGAGGVSEDELIGEMKSGRTWIFVVIAVGVLAIAGLIAALAT